MAQFRVYALEALPIPETLNLLICKQIESFISKILGNEGEKVVNEGIIDTLVYVLYDLTYDEVRAVDPGFTMTEEEYNDFKQQHQDK